MTPVQVIFIISAAMILGAAWMVVSRSNMVHAALFLIIALFGVAVQFVLLEAGFLAVIQVLVYIGAIAILMIFAVMLTRGVTGDDGDRYNDSSRLAGMVAFFTFAIITIIVGGWPQYYATSSPADTSGSIEALGVTLFSQDAYVVPSIVASMLLLAALIGSVVIAWQRKPVED